MEGPKATKHVQHHPKDIVAEAFLSSVRLPLWISSATPFAAATAGSPITPLEIKLAYSRHYARLSHRPRGGW